MIARIAGQIQYVTATYVVVDVKGVGYKVHSSPMVLTELKKGEEIILHTHEYIRENIQDLFGFKTQEELEIFEQLISVSGIGPKSALSILAIASPQAIAEAVAQENEEIFSQASGIGPKTAARAVIDLKGKLVATGNGEAAAGLTGNSELIQALVGLGYSANQAKQAVKNVKAEASTSEKIKQALQHLSS